MIGGFRLAPTRKGGAGQPLSPVSSYYRERSSRQRQPGREAKIGSGLRDPGLGKKRREREPGPLPPCPGRSLRPAAFVWI